MKDLKKEIELVVAKANTFPKNKGLFIEYNFRELPVMEGVTKDNFLGIPARENKERTIDTSSIIYQF